MVRTILFIRFEVYGNIVFEVYGNIVILIARCLGMCFDNLLLVAV
jgi:hypothetical protein